MRETLLGKTVHLGTEAGRMSENGEFPCLLFPVMEVRHYFNSHVLNSVNVPSLSPSFSGRKLRCFGHLSVHIRTRWGLLLQEGKPREFSDSELRGVPLVT